MGAIDVRATDHDSDKVAADFEAGIQIINMLTSKTKSIQLPFEPKQLNFAIFGTITFTINGNRHTCRNMRLAQGHDSTGNNWWIAGPGCFGITSEGVLNCRKWIPGP